MFSILLALQVLVSIGIITLVMLQQGKGADMGAGFGAGASGTVFGARGSGSFFTRATAILATIFFINCLLIASPLVRHIGKPREGIAERIEQQAAQGQEQAKTDAIADKLDKIPSGAASDMPATATGQAAPGTGEDIPDVPATTSGSDGPATAEPGTPAPDDLPQ